jgi:DNA replication protein DnaC
VSVSTHAPKTELPEPERLETGWRLRSRCPSCGVEVLLDSPDEFEEDGETVSIAEPTELARKLVRNGVWCTDCETKEESARERAKLAQDFKARLETSRLPRDLQRLGWHQMDRAGSRREPVVAARAWTENGGGLLLYGPIGVGKTRLAATATWELLQTRLVRWVSVPVLLAQSVAAFSDTAKRDATEILTGSDALVLDDIDKGKPSEWARQVLFAAIDRRVQAGSPLIVTSNLDADELAERFGDWAGSRLAGYCRQFELSGADRRLHD